MTHPHPTFSGVVGILAAALGRPPRQPNADLRELSMTIRIDNPGRVIRDWHTVGGGLPKPQTVPTADGKRRGSGLLFEDWYVSGAAFTVAMAGEDDTITKVTRALASPAFPLFLGRRNCPPDSRILVHRTDDPDRDLAEIPLHREKETRSSTVRILFVHDQDPGTGAATIRYVDDGLGSDGEHVSRSVWDVETEMPATRCAGLGTAWVRSLNNWKGGDVS